MVGVGVAVVGVDFPSPKPVGTDLFRRDFQTFSGCRQSVETAGLRAEISQDRIRCTSPGRMEPASAAKVPLGIGPERIGPQGRFGHRSSSPAGAARRCECRGRAYRSPKSLPGRAPAVQRASAPGYHPHRLRHGTEFPTVEVSPAPLLPPRCFLLGEARSSTRPALRTGGPLRLHCTRKTSDLPPGIEIPCFHPY